MIQSSINFVLIGFIRISVASLIQGNLFETTHWNSPSLLPWISDCDKLDKSKAMA